MGDGEDCGVAAIERPITLVDLPSELISEILRREEIACEDLRSVGNTCRRLKRVVSADSRLWMNKMCKKWPDLISLKNYDSCFFLSNPADLNWFHEYKNMMITFARCRKKITEMSSTYYWAPVSLSKCHIRDDFFPMCHDQKLLYLLIFLRDLCLKDVPKNFDSFYNLTNQYYASVVLDFLNQYLLQRIWSTISKENNPILTPEKIILFYNQWMEPKYREYNKKFDIMMSSIVKTLISFLPDTHPLHKIEEEERKKWSTVLISNNKYDGENCKIVIKLACEVIKNYKLLSNTTPTFNTMLIRNVIEQKESNNYYSPLILEAVLRRCGIRCDVAYFSDHHLLVWRENWEERSPPYLLNPYTGVLKSTTRRCPFAPNELVNLQCYNYSPLKLLTNLAKYMGNTSMDYYKAKRVIKRSLELLTFLKPNNVEHLILLGKLCLDLKNDPRDIACKLRRLLETKSNTMSQSMRIGADHILDQLHEARKNMKKSKRKETVKYRNQYIKFAVGMVCRHKIYGYLCVINGWDAICAASEEWKMNMGVHNLTFDDQQPFYNVLVDDFTERYAAQENLIYVHGTRLVGIEEELGVNFLHFNGSFYVPNDEKRREYPEEEDFATFITNLSLAM